MNIKLCVWNWISNRGRFLRENTLIFFSLFRCRCIIRWSILQFSPDLFTFSRIHLILLFDLFSPSNHWIYFSLSSLQTLWKLKYLFHLICLIIWSILLIKTIPISCLIRLKKTISSLIHNWILSVYIEEPISSSLRRLTSTGRWINWSSCMRLSLLICYWLLIRWSCSCNRIWYLLLRWHMLSRIECGCLKPTCHRSWHWLHS